MDTFDAYRLRHFVDFVINNDPQITAHRREARALYARAMDDDGTFTVAADKAEKILTFLTLNDNQVHGAGHEGAVSVYAFIRLVGELRRKLRDVGVGTGATTPQRHTGPAPPEQPHPQALGSGGGGDLPPGAPVPPFRGGL